MYDPNLERALGSALQNAISSSLLLNGLLTTFILLIAVIFARALLIRQVKGNSEILNKEQRIWINRIKNTAIAFMMVALIFIWAPQIQTFALSLTAVAVAIVLTTKELLMCLTGGFMRATGKAFRVGDWISIENMTGEVMEISTLSTTLEEIDPKTRQFSGRTLHIPNSKFLTTTIENANFLKHYIYHTIQMSVAYQDIDPIALLGTLEKIVTAHYEPHHKAADRFNKMVERKTGIDFADAKAECNVKTTDLGHYMFSVRFFAATKDLGQLESGIMRAFLAESYRMRSDTKNANPPDDAPQTAPEESPDKGGKTAKTV